MRLGPSNGGMILGTSSTYATARDTGTTATGTGNIIAGQTVASGTYSCWETFLEFDTTNIRTIPSTLTLMLPNVSSFGNPTLRVAAYDWGTSLTTGDYRTASQLTALTVAGTAVADAADNIPAVPTYITLDTSCLNLGGKTRLVIYDAAHAAGTVPVAVGHCVSKYASAGDTTESPLLIFGSGFDALQVFAAFGSQPLANGSLPPARYFYDITDDLRGYTVTRGKSGELDQYAAGIASIVLTNNSYQYDPDNASSPYVGKLLPASPVRIVALRSDGTPEQTFEGFVQQLGGFTFDYVAGPTRGAGVSTATLSCVDFFGLLAGQNLPAVVLADGESPAYEHDRSLTFLDDLVTDGTIPQPGQGWLLGGDGHGQTVIQGYFGGANALSYVQNLNDTEAGQLMVLKDGTPAFYNRQARSTETRFTTAQATFGDRGGTDIPIKTGSFAKAYANVVYNRVSITVHNSTTLTADNATSITKYGTQDLSYSDLLMNPGAEAGARCELYVKAFASPISAPAQLAISPRRASAVLDAALDLELGDYCKVDFSVPGSTNHEWNVFVRSISHVVDVGAGEWTTTFGLESADRWSSFITASFFTLGSSLLGGGDLLGW